METSANNRPNTFGMPPREASLMARQGTLDGDGLLRSLMSHDRWLVPTRDDDGPASIAVLTTPDGGRIIEIFSDLDALAGFCAAEELERPATRAMPGYRFFSTLDESRVDRVKIDVHADHHFSYGRDQFPLLRAWADTVRTEVALLTPERIANPLRALHAHPEYVMAVHHVDGESELVLAPDADERSLAAVFTADDLANEFVAAMTPYVDGRLELVRQSGDATLRMLAALDLDGVVFNPLTSLGARALSADVLPAIIDEATRSRASYSRE